ncbi:MAG: TIGR04282 family arsenosugar biosynthesis glycosyltransferase [Deltaproteobacteria bacterium]|nr:TIGR04282 family arsenosugar biosynthesis glycosyltransferase [Deltaproteobacteria bacterium]
MVVMVIYVKAPRPGQVKTRLFPVLHPAEAAEVYQLSLQTVVEQVESLGAVHSQIWTFGEEDQNYLEALFPHRSFRTQTSGDLGERMWHTFATLFQEKEGPVFILGSDAPTLPTEFLRQGIQLIKQYDCVLGPTRDGGYYTLGLRRIDRKIFQGISWSQSSVLSETVAHLKSLGWSYQLLPEWYDIDRPEDLTLAWQDLENLHERTRYQEKLRVYLQNIKGECHGAS